MSRLKTVGPEEATGDVKRIFDGFQKEFGMVPNLIRALGNSPVALKAYVTLDSLISEGGLSPAEREIVRLVVSEVNRCRYCVAAHTLAGRAVGLNEDDVLAARRGHSNNQRHAALAAFAKAVVEKKGFVDDGEIERFRAVGYSDNEIGEVVAIIGQKTISNFFNHIHETELDFPAAVELETV
jgi:uncharacterized peroxidase-related enzyme